MSKDGDVIYFRSGSLSFENRRPEHHARRRGVVTARKSVAIGPPERVGELTRAVNAAGNVLQGLIVQNDRECRVGPATDRGPLLPLQTVGPVGSHATPTRKFSRARCSKALVEISEASAIGRAVASRRADTAGCGSALCDGAESERAGLRGGVEPDRATALAALDRDRSVDGRGGSRLVQCDRKEADDQDAQHDAWSDLTVHGCRRVRFDPWVRSLLP